MNDLFSLKGRTALITGGSRGIGRMIAAGFLAQGARVYISARKAMACDQTAIELSKQGFCVSLPGDVATVEGAKALAAEFAAREDKLDILVNNAGAAWGAPAEDHPLEAWYKVINLNLTAMFLVSQAVGKHSMIPRKYGRIVNIASIAGLVGTDPRMMPTIAYNASKGGVVNFTRSLAVEWAHHGINVNAIAPGVFRSKMAQGMIDKSEDIILSMTPMKRLGSDHDLKGLSVLLASNASAYITGQIVAVDGGMVAL